PPSTIISVPVQSAVCKKRVSGALLVVALVQLSVLGLYLPPVLKRPLLLSPPQTIISLPVHTAVCQRRPSGALVRLVGVHVSSVQPPDGLATTGSVYVALFRFVALMRLSVEATVSAAKKFLGAGDTPATTVGSAAKRFVNTGLARHSAITK